MNPPIRVLCVDDETSFLELAKLMLERTGIIQLETAQSAEKALGILEETEYDAVVSDFAMPGMDGIEFLKTLRAREDLTPFIMFTGKGREEVAMEALNNGADLYIQKGSDVRAQFAELTMMIRKLADHRKAELRARQEKEVLSLLVDTDLTGLVAFDAQSRIIMWNPGMEKMSGLSADRAIGKLVSEVIPTLEGKDVDVHLSEVLSGERIALRDMSFSIPETGKEGYFRSFSSPTYDSAGQVSGGLTVIIDISEEKTLEDAFRSSESRYRTLFEGAGDAIFIHSLDGRFLDVNRAACEALGYEREELLCMTPKDVDGLIFASTTAGRNSNSLNTAPIVAHRLGIYPKSICVRVDTLCSGSNTAIILATGLVESGIAEVVLVCGTEKLNMPQRWESVYMNLMTNDHDWDSAMGLAVPPPFFGMIAQAHMEKYGTTKEQMGTVAVTNYEYGNNNPNAQFSGKTLNLVQYLEAREVCDPFGLNDCCPVTDGASAVIIASEERAKAMTDRPLVYIRGTGQTATHGMSAGCGAMSTTFR